jgi:hypothetical protein
LKAQNCLDSVSLDVPWSGYVPKVHLVTAENVGKDGGPKNVFDPDSGYREKDKGIWGSKSGDFIRVAPTQSRLVLP